MMNEYTDTIPDWNADGVLPPFLTDPVDIESINRSPYSISLVDLIVRFGNTEGRRKQLIELLNFRSQLHKAGMTKGFQWINGSFVEEVEQTRPERPAPKDIDVVTFYHIPEGLTDENLDQSLSHILNDLDYVIDAYFVQLNDIDAELLVDWTSYWYGLWSHKRETFQWKGFVQVSLQDTEDHAAISELNRMSGEVGGLP